VPQIQSWHRAVPKGRRRWADAYEVVGIVLFEDVLDIDDLGDECVQVPHVYAPFASGRRGPFKRFIAVVEAIDGWDGRSFYPEKMSDGRIEYFPAVVRELNDDSK
jgi:hypothetical protein